jgi:hypothetical protein
LKVLSNRSSLLCTLIKFVALFILFPFSVTELLLVFCF